MKPVSFTNGDFEISTDKSSLDIPFIHWYLSEEADWSEGISIETVRASIDASLNFGIYKNGVQVGFARIITDFATIAYLGDVFIIENHRGKGLSKWLMDVIMQHPNLQGLRRWILLTDTAEWLYEKYGFRTVERPELYMEKYNPNVYKNKS